MGKDNNESTFDQRMQQVYKQINVAGNVYLWNAVPSSILRWLSQVFTVMVFAILLVWFISKSDLPTVELGSYILDLSIIKTWISNLGIKLDFLKVLASLFASGFFALFTWRLARAVASGQEESIDPKRVITIASGANATPRQLTSGNIAETRKAFLDQIKSTWLRRWEALDNAEGRIAVLMQYVSHDVDAVQGRDWHSNEHAIKSDIIKIYNDHKRGLLLLGKPGAGKTTMLHKLCRHLYDKATLDTEEPIPVFLSLSSWRRTYKNLEEWLSDGLLQEYRFNYFHTVPLFG